MRGWRCWAEAWLVLAVYLVWVDWCCWCWVWFVGFRIVGWPDVAYAIDGDEPESLILAQSERWRNA